MNPTTSLRRCFFPLLAAGLFLAALFPLRMHGQYSYYLSPMYYPSGPPATMRASAGMTGFEVPLERAGHYFSFKWRVRAADPITAGSAQTMGFVTASNVAGDTTMRSVLVTAYTQSTYVYTPVVYTYPGTTYTYTYYTYTSVPFACFDWWLVDTTANEEFYHPGTPGPGEDLRNVAWRQLGSIPTRSFTIPEARFGHALVAGSPAGGWSPVTSGYSTFGTYSNGTTGTQVPLHWFTGSAPLGAGDFSIADRTDGTKAPLNQTNVSAASWVHDYSVYPLASVTFYLPAAELNNLYVLHYQIPGQVAAAMSLWPMAVSSALNTTTVNAGTKTVPAGAATVTGTVAVGANFWLTRNLDNYSTTPPFALTAALANATILKRWWLAPPRAAVTWDAVTFGIASTRAAQTFTVSQPSSNSAASPGPGGAAARPILTYQDYAANGSANSFNYFTVTALVNRAEPFNLVAQTGGAPEVFSNRQVWVLDGWAPIGGAPGTLPAGIPGQFNFALTVTGPEPVAGLTLTAPSGASFPLASSAPSALTLDDQWHAGTTWTATQRTWTLAQAYTGPMGDWLLTNPAAGQDWSLPLNVGNTTDYLRDLHYQAKVKPLALNISLSRWAFDTAPRLRLHQRDGTDFPVNARSTTAWAARAPDDTVWVNSTYTFLTDTSVRDGVDYWLYDEETGEESPYNTTDLITWFALPTPAGLAGAVNPAMATNDLQWPLGLAALEGAFTVERQLSGETAWQTIGTVVANNADASNVLHFTDANPVPGKIHSYQVRYTYGTGTAQRRSARSNFVALTGWVNSNGDGIPDWWKIFYGLDLYDLNVAHATSAGGDLNNLQRYQNHLNPNAPLAHPPANPDPTAPPPPPTALAPLDDLAHTSYSVVNVSNTTTTRPITQVALNDSNNVAFGYADSDGIHTAVFAHGAVGSSKLFPYQGTTTELVSNYVGTNWQTSYPPCHYYYRSLNSVNADGSISGWMFVNLPYVSLWGNYTPVTRGFIDSGSGPADFWQYSDNAPSYSPYGDNFNETGTTYLGNAGLIAGIGYLNGSGYGFVGSTPSSMQYFDQYYSLSSQRLRDHFSPQVFSPDGDSAGTYAAYDLVYGLGTSQYAVCSGTIPIPIGKLHPLAVGNGGVVLGVDENATDSNDALAIYQNGTTQHLSALLPQNYQELIRFPSTSTGWVNGNGDIVVDAQVFQTPPPAADGTTPPATWLTKTLLWQRNPAEGPPRLALCELPSGNAKQFNADRCFAAIGPVTTTDASGHTTTTEDRALLLLPVEIAGDNDDDGDIDQADRPARDKHPIVLQRKLNKTNTERTLIVRKIAISGVPVKFVKTGDEKVIIKSKQTGAVLMSETETESTDIGPFVSQADYEITVEGVDNGKGTIALKVGDAGTPADPMPIRVLNADVIFRNGSQALADMIGTNVSHGGLDTGNGNVRDIGGFGPEAITVGAFYARAKTATKRRVSFKQTNYMAGRIWEKIFDNIIAGKLDNPTGAKPWNVFTTSDNYATSNCLEWLHKQWQRAVKEVHGELQDAQQKTAFETAYYNGQAVKDLAPPDLIKTIQGPIPAAELFVAGAMAAADFSGSGEADPAVFHNAFEGNYYWFYPGYYGVPDDQVPLLIKILTDPEWEEGQLRTISPKSYLNSNFFLEVPY